MLDGECVLCQSAAQRLIRWGASDLYFTSQTSKIGKAFVEDQGGDAVIYASRRNVYTGHEGVFAALKHVDRPWRWLRILRFLPGSVLSVVYRFVAKRRKRWFGLTVDVCRRPPALLRERVVEKTLPWNKR